LFNQVKECVDTPYRKNLTLLFVAEKITKMSKYWPGEAIASGNLWMFNRNNTITRSTETMTRYLKRNYYLVGVMGRINEFLVLLALHNGWDIHSMYYLPCKRTNLGIRTSDFAELFPNLYRKLESFSRPDRTVYERLRKEFDSHIAALEAVSKIKWGRTFSDIVNEYETGLAQYQNRTMALNLKPFQWRKIVYKDKTWEDC
jgi:hypothetical protein